MFLPQPGIYTVIEIGLRRAPRVVLTPSAAIGAVGVDDNPVPVSALFHTKRCRWVQQMIARSAFESAQVSLVKCLSPRRSRLFHRGICLRRSDFGGVGIKT